MVIICNPDTAVYKESFVETRASLPVHIVSVAVFYAVTAGLSICDWDHRDSLTCPVLACTEDVTGPWPRSSNPHMLCDLWRRLKNLLCASVSFFVRGRWQSRFHWAPWDLSREKIGMLSEDLGNITNCTRLPSHEALISPSHVGWGSSSCCMI